MAATTWAPGLTDTDILIDAARGLPEAGRFLAEQQAGGSVQISIVSAMELVVGCRDTEELARVRQFLASVLVHPIRESVSRVAYDLVASLWLSHGLLAPDALIAGTAREQGLKLYTKNLRHFRMIPELVADRPY